LFLSYPVSPLNPVLSCTGMLSWFCLIFWLTGPVLLLFCRKIRISLNFT
jgi:hypothetical protein